MAQPSYRGRRLDATVRELHQAVDLLTADTVPASYYLQVLAGRGQPTGQASPAVVEVVEDQADQAAQGALFGEVTPAG